MATTSHYGYTLSECPFCLTSEWIEIQNFNDRMFKPEVVCGNCGASMQGEHPADAVANWNKREVRKIGLWTFLKHYFFH